MGKINFARVILGGLLAGLVINIGEYLLNEPILGEQWRAVMVSLNRPIVGGSQIAVFVILGFVLGIAMVWLYAAIRPRFGPGPKTAICAGLFIWFLVYLYASIIQHTLALFPDRLLLISTIWGLVELSIAAVAGAWLYTEA